MGLSASTLGCRGRDHGPSLNTKNTHHHHHRPVPQCAPESITHHNLIVKQRVSAPQKRRSSSLREPILSLVKDMHHVVNTSDDAAIKSHFSNHFTLASRRRHKQFAYGTKNHHAGGNGSSGNRRRSHLPKGGVGSRDFDHYQLIGKGGFGAVLRAQRTDTGKWYALKVQPMESMARSSRSGAKKIEDETALHMERTVLAACRGHPFIVSLEYAFHTRRFAVLAMDYIEGGTLSQLISGSPGMMLPFDLVKTYTIEIALGINFMHSRGIIYRDLKPSNILVDRSGHIRLTDFGLSGSLVKHKRPVSSSMDDGSHSDSQDPNLPPLSPSLPRSARMPRDIREPTRSTDYMSDSSGDPEMSDQDEVAVRQLAGAIAAAAANTGTTGGEEGGEHDIRWVRRRTVCGTAGYRPPEQVQERYTDYSSRIGYDERADWFALGVCCYTMVTGRRPFPTKKELQRSERSFTARKSSLTGSGDTTPRVGNLSREASKKVLNDAEFRCLMFEVPFSAQFDTDRDAESFIRALLERDPRDRLGYDAIVNHAWMRDEDFTTDGALARSIPQWVRDHAYLNMTRVARKENHWHHWKRYLRSRAEGHGGGVCGGQQYSSLNECIDDTIIRCFETHDAAYAQGFRKKWTASTSKKTTELFQHWTFVSSDALRLEMDCASDENH